MVSKPDRKLPVVRITRSEPSEQMRFAARMAMFRKMLEDAKDG